MRSDKKLVTAAQVAERMGVTTKAVWALARTGQIPVVRISERRHRFDPDDIERWLDRRTTTRPVSR